METIVIVASCESYRTGDFVTAARAQRLRVVVATDADSPFANRADSTIQIDLDNPAEGAARIAAEAPSAAAVVAVDDQGVRVAAAASALLGLATNPSSAVDATRDKLSMRRLLEAGGVSQPAFREVGTKGLAHSAAEIGFPVVVKPTSLAASRGVIRVDGAETAPLIEARVRDILEDAGLIRSAPLIVEQYIAGHEMVVEGIIVDGNLEVLALIDKPVPLVGPFFEETMFVSPSRQAPAVQDRVIATVSAAIDAIRLVTGPVHAEVRVDADGAVYIIEIAARSIGGLCGRSLTFGLLAEPLESVVIRSAVGRSGRMEKQSKPATGVLMLPIPAAGTLTGIDGIEGASGIEGIDEIEITVPFGRTVAPLPEGDRYLGFVFASGRDADAVEASLRAAAAAIDPTIDGEYVTSDGQFDAAG
jgi:biotin carboxylase